MACHNDCSQFDLAMELLIANGFEGVAETIGILMNTAMQIKRSRHLRAKPYERTDTMQRKAYGYRDMEFFKLNIIAPHKAKYALIG